MQTITELSKKYDELYAKASKILDDFNPMLVFRTGKEEIMQTIPTCNKCGRPAASKPSGYGYDVFLVKDGCGCGGEFVVRKNEKPTLPESVLPQCLNCLIARRCDENTLYIPCKVTCIMTGAKFNAS